MSSVARFSMYASPVASALAVAVWCMATPTTTGQYPAAEDVRLAIAALRQSNQSDPAKSVLQQFSEKLFTNSLRPDLRPPPPPKPKAVVQPKKVAKPPVPRPAPLPPLRINLTLIGTVIENENSHAVLKNPAGVVLVLRIGDHLPAPDDAVFIQAIDVDSATFAKGKQTAVIEAKQN